MITICKRFTFEAAHRLGEVFGGQLHGHSYSAEIRMRAMPDSRGFVEDYDVIAAAWKLVGEKIDHKYLNDVPGLSIPSTEWLAWWIMDHLVYLLPQEKLVSVRVYESFTTWAELTTSDYEVYRRTPEIVAVIG